jgi:hypothetical protein
MNQRLDILNPVWACEKREVLNLAEIESRSSGPWPASDELTAEVKRDSTKNKPEPHLLQESVIYVTQPGDAQPPASPVLARGDISVFRSMC